MKRWIAAMLCCLLLVMLAGCAQPAKEASYKPVSGLDTNQKVQLRIAIAFETDRALDMVVNRFMEKYPNVSVKLEYLEDYEKNSALLVHNNAVDIVFARDKRYAVTTEKDEATGKETTYTTDDDYYDFATDTEIDFSGTTPKLMGNYTHTRVDEDGKEIKYMYTPPVGGEVRGVFVNKTLLASVGKSVPATWSEFVDCCEALHQAGYIPVQGNPSTAATAMMLANAVNSVTHDAAKLEQYRTVQPGVSQLFAPSMEKLYQLATARYYDYKYVEEQGKQFLGASDVAQARSFLGLKRNDETYEYDPPENGSGTVGFFPYLSYLGTVLDKLIEDYQLKTDYAFVITPTAEGDDSPTYLTPYYGFCLNKKSENLNWGREFVNFFFQEEICKLYAENSGIIPNTADAMSLMAAKYGVDEQKSCASCGDIYFSDTFNGYTPLANALINVFKCSAPKYMIVLEKDENGQIVYQSDENGEYLLTDNGEKAVKIYKQYIGQEDPARPGYAFCTLAYYVDELEAALDKYRVQ